MATIPAGIYKLNESLLNEGYYYLIPVPFKVLPIDVEQEGETVTFTSDNFNSVLIVKNGDTEMIVMYINSNDNSLSELNPMQLYANGEVSLTFLAFGLMIIIDEDIVNVEPLLLLENDTEVLLRDLIGDAADTAGRSVEVLLDTIVEDDLSMTFFKVFNFSGSSSFPTAKTIKDKLQSLIDKSNSVTNNYDTTLTEAILSLISKYDNVKSLPNAEDYEF